jgi:hypothetical protein
MSRDLTPRQTLVMEKYTGFSVFDMMEHTTLLYKGEEQPLYTPEQISLRKQFPLFGKLINNFESLFFPLSKIEGGEEFLREKEKELEKWIEKEEGDYNSYLIKWFEGELDPNFYYSERNEEMFIDEMVREAGETAKKPSETKSSNILEANWDIYEAGFRWDGSEKLI